MTVCCNCRSQVGKCGHVLRHAAPGARVQKNVISALLFYNTDVSSHVTRRQIPCLPPPYTSWRLVQIVNAACSVSRARGRPLLSPPLSSPLPQATLSDCLGSPVTGKAMCVLAPPPLPLLQGLSCLFRVLSKLGNYCSVHVAGAGDSSFTLFMLGLAQILWSDTDTWRVYTGAAV